MDDNKDLELEINENAENNPFRENNIEIQEDETINQSTDEVEKLKADFENLNNKTNEKNSFIVAFHYNDFIFLFMYIHGF